MAEADAGTFTCIAESGNDTLEAQAELAVQGRSEVLIFTENTSPDDEILFCGQFCAPLKTKPPPILL